MKTEKPYSLPASLTITVNRKWLDLDGEYPQIRFALAITGPKGKMDCPYSGGIMAFLPDDKRNTEAARDASRKCRVLWDEERRNAALPKVLQWSAVKPESVVHSLISDARAGEMPFPEFCIDFGYDEDSRKAFQTWQDCQNLGYKFKQICGAALFEEMEKGLADY